MHTRRQLLRGLGALVVVALAVHAKNQLTPYQIAAESVSDVSLIKHFEGLRLEAYKDPGGVWTIGYGHTRNVYEGMVITEQEAEALLWVDISWVEVAINRNVMVPLTQNQYDALASWVFNLGETNLKRSTLLRKLNNADYDGAAQEFLRWDKLDGETLDGLTRRREAEVALWTT